MIHCQKTLFILFFLTTCSILSATTYYVAPNGTDGAYPSRGTLANPWRTWQYAFTKSTAGDTVFFRGGVYYVSSMVYKSANGGTQANPICYFAYPPDWQAGNYPILDGANKTSGSCAIATEGLSYLNFKGLTVRNHEQKSIDDWDCSGFLIIGGSNINFELCVAQNTGFRGWDLNEVTGTCYIINCDSYDNVDHLTQASHPGNHGQGFCITTATASTPVDNSTMYFIGCRAWGNSDTGFSSNYGNHQIFEHCWSWDNGRLQGEGEGFKYGPGGYFANGLLSRYIHNCIAAYNISGGEGPGAGFDSNDNEFNYYNYDVDNNIAYANGWGFVSFPSGSNASRTTRRIRNNISYANTVANYEWHWANHPTATFNTWNNPPNVTVNAADFVALPSSVEQCASILGAVRKSDGSLPDLNGYFELASGSDLVDAGINVGLPYNGSAPDLGYSEQYSGSVTPSIPAYLHSVIEDATPARLEMTYNLTLANIVPPASAFTVRVNSVIRSLTSVTVSGTKVSLTLDSPVVFGDIVTIAYTKPSTNPLQTTSGGQAASLTAQTVQNSVNPVNPVYVSSVIENATPARLEMTYNLTLANIVPPASAFTVRVNSVIRSLTSVTVSGTKVSLTLDSPVVFGDIVTIAYTKPSTNPLQTTSGGQAASLTAQTVQNSVNPVNPVYVSSVIENATPARLEMTYNLTLANIVPPASAFTVRVNSVIRSLTSVTVSGTKVSLTLDSPVVFGDIVTIAYTKPSTNPLQTASGGQAASLTAQTVQNSVNPVNPVYVSSVIENATPARLEMTYNLTLANIVPPASAFTVRVNSVIRSLTSVTVSGTKVSLTLDSPVVFGDIVTIAYTKPSTNPLQTASGGQAASLTAQTVINNCSLVANEPPVIDITSPTKSTSFISLATITIEATAFDPDGTINKVEFFSGGNKIGERTVQPYSYVWKDVTDGTYNISAVATDNLGAKTVSAVVYIVVEKSSITINQIPDVKIVFPEKSKRYKRKESIVIEVEAFDPDGTISTVELKSGNITLAETNTSPFIFILDNVDVGTYEVTAIATDNLGATNISSPIEFIVDPLYNIYSDNINIYPNPNDGKFTIELLTPLPSNNNSIIISNLSGKILSNKKMSEEISIVDFDLTSSSPGTYILIITSDNAIISTEKFIKR